MFFLYEIPFENKLSNIFFLKEILKVKAFCNLMFVFTVERFNRINNFTKYLIYFNDDGIN